MNNAIFEQLNKEQILPCKDTQGAVLVIAGAGSGKTRVLTSRIAYLVNELNIRPSEILAITFTNKAADEMKFRLNKMIDGVEDMWVSTIHSMCVKILRSSIQRLGFKQSFTIYTEDEKEKVLKRIISEMELDTDKYLKLAKNIISSAKNDDLSPTEYKDEHIKQSNIGIYTEIYAKYQQVLKQNNALDFDDLLIYTLHLFLEDDEVKEYYARKFKYIHVDEFQDTNKVQYKIIKMLSSYWGNIFVVGDDDQSIYGWRGAKISNILNFDKDFIGAKVYKLEQNYRSTKQILNLANTVIKDNNLRRNKTLWTNNEDGFKPIFYVGEEEINEAEFVAKKIKSAINSGKKASDFAVLMRINALSRSFEQEFLKYNIPYKVFGGFKFFDRKEIKDILAYLRIMVNPFDNEAVLRIINVPRRGIGEKTINILYESAVNEGLSLFDKIFSFEELTLTSSAKNRIGEFKDLLYNLVMKSGEMSIVDFVKTVIKETGILAQFEEDTEENYEKRLNINELVNSVEEYAKLNKDAKLLDYLSSVTLSSDTDDLSSGNFVTIATIHAVKGLEFDGVFLVGLDETILPIQRACDSVEELEEERRLMYVAITRAKRNLYATRARSRYLYGQRSLTIESRFLKGVKDCFQDESPFSRQSYGYNYGYNQNRGYNSQYKKPAYSETGYYSDIETEPRLNGGVKSFSSGYTQSQKLEKNTQNSTYKTGMRVLHIKFGEGTIIAVKESSSGQVVDVAFKNVGIKSLASQYAPLKVIK